MRLKLFISAAVAGIASLAMSAAVAQTVNLVYANPFAKTHVQYGVLADEWIAEIRKSTEGRVVIRHVPGGALLKLENMLEGLRGGVADIGVTNVSNFAGQLPIASTLAGVADINYGNKVDTIGLSLITLKLLEEFPEYRKDFDDLGLRPAAWIPTPTFAVITRAPVSRLDEFKGKKIRAFGVGFPRVLIAAGATPLAISAGEVYTSLQAGVIDGSITDPPNMVSSRWHEQAKHVITTGPGAGAQTMAVGVAYLFNKNSWNKISKQDQAIIEQVNTRFTLAAGQRMQAAGEQALVELKSKGVTVRHLSKDETAELARRVPDALSGAASMMDAAGRPGTAIVKRYTELVDAYAQGKLKP